MAGVSENNERVNSPGSGSANSENAHPQGAAC